MVRRLYQASRFRISSERRRHPMELHTIGIDLGKTVFHLVGLNLRGEVVVRKKFSRKQLLHFTANLQAKLIGMEACGGSHFLGRALREQGHEVRLMPAQYVKPYVKTNKSDYIDAEAIAEAVGRPKMRFVPIKSDDQLDLQSLHRVRERWVMRRTAVINQIRGLLLERSCDAGVLPASFFVNGSQESPFPMTHTMSAAPELSRLTHAVASAAPAASSWSAIR